MPTSFLTREGYDKLQDELDQLRTARRQEIADRLHEAMEGGELIDNAEYEAAKNEQAFVEGRIKELEILLATAKIVDETAAADTVQIGVKVTITEEGSDELETYALVGAAEANPAANKISNESPMAKGLLGHKVGDTVEIEIPNGSMKVKILSVK